MTGKDINNLCEAASAIPPGKRINVTFLGNEDLDMRVAAAKAVKELDFIPAPHISARRLASQGEREEFLAALHNVSASEHVFVVGGDPETPAGPRRDHATLTVTGPDQPGLNAADALQP